MSQTLDQKQSSPKLTVKLAPFWKKFGAWVYDLLGALAVFILAMVVGYVIIFIMTIPWIENGQALSKALYMNPLWSIYLFASVQYYYVWCWVKGGQTMGMKTWRLKLCKPDGSHLTWKEAYIRSFASLGGLSQIWGIVDKENRGIHDFIFDTRVVELPKDYTKENKPII
ncbi:RDD family protein [Aliikangiella marina]|uniref:RDD family protein n=1 Tax=Aliikangiella marina TaxID=1712262 RepID=UPI00163D8578|nr:RDD family protein [Aliikangiella marina]